MLVPYFSVSAFALSAFEAGEVLTPGRAALLRGWVTEDQLCQQSRQLPVNDLRGA